MLVLAAPLSVTSAAATPVNEGQTTAITKNVDVWERSLLPLRTSSEGPTTVAAPQTFINVENTATGDVSLNRDQYTIHQADESVDLTFEGRAGAGTESLAGDEAQLLAVKLSDSPDAAGFSDGSARTDLANIFTNDSTVESVELLDDGEGVGSIDDNGALETSYTPESGGVYGFILVTVDDGQGLSVSDTDVSADGNVTVVGVEQTVVQEDASTVEATNNDVAAGDNITLDVDTELDDDSATHAVLLFNGEELEQQTSTVRVTGDIDENFSEDQITVENSFDGVSGVSTTDSDASFSGGDSTAVSAMPSAGLLGLFGFVLTEASSDTTGDNVMHASAVTVSDDADTTVDVQTLDSWPNGTYTYVHVAVGEDSNEINSDTGTISLTESNESDSDGDTGDSGDDSDSDDDGANNGDNNTGDSNNGDSDNGDSNSGGSNDGDSGDGDDGSSDNDSSDNESDDNETEDGTDEVDTEDEDATEDETDADDGTETDDTDAGDEPTEATTTAGGGAQQPDEGATGTEGSVETTSSSGPGFTVLVTVLALLGSGLLARRD
jgi:PGF-CTERM protein